MHTHPKNWQSIFGRIVLLMLVCTIFPQSITAQVENLSKLPDLTRDINKAKEYKPIVMPDDYPEELTSFFDKSISSRSFIVVDVETGRILAQRGANIPYPIASTTKILTAYLTYRAIEDGKLKLTSEIEAPSDLTQALSDNPELTSTPLIAGEKYSVDDLLHALIMKSGNDAASLLMREIYGSESSATQAMIDQLHKWGIVDFDLYTTSGVPNEFIPEGWRMPGSIDSNENAMSTQDLALMTQHVITEFPQLIEISSVKDYTFQQGGNYEQLIHTPNPFLPGQSLEREGINGLKAGLTDGAGDSFVATGKENGREIIAISMGNFIQEDGSFSSSYDQLTLILDALAEHPDLYKNEKLPVNHKPSPEEIKATEDETQTSEESDSLEDEQRETSLENHRDNPITNFFKNLFDNFR
ncbi:D-alanyl-D-alanine carboxypeptidase family protein [Facklamia miroungae]|uniref:D-alanyl-D-alanine carboxypeptidase (Penicillin-binding protein 5/6) n=1 Tax=Facklamia miroungae TaxID=120956 RepID=A0A1G7TPH8_9LACT|nr:serine hydrolase [Facklamia miroungae]NKZ29777.1 D-alanyl-D-alanine carboxypeptidase [Facklamia miroungae]SDG36380.1 D-alanyl-D-alanine carboxypeptidase (penicillin-binding protein 5/6) [Facklamia miroungae]